VCWRRPRGLERGLQEGRRERRKEARIVRNDNKEVYQGRIARKNNKEG
jgi:hypothetical protein